MKNKIRIKSIICICLALLLSILAVNPQKVEAASTVGILSIISDGNTDDDWYGVHSFLLYKNTSKQNQIVAGVKVRPNHSITIGTYGNKSDGKGVYINLEAFLATKYGAYSSRVSLSIPVTSSTLKNINYKIKKCNKWTYTNNCSWFAKEVWNFAVPKSQRISISFPITPKKLSDIIKKKRKYKNKIALPKVYSAVYRYKTNNIATHASSSTKKSSSSISK